MTNIRPCSADPELFFAPLKADQEKAAAICAGCPFRTECAQYAVDNQILWGTWGGLTERARRPKKARPPKPPAVCGTSIAFWRHRSKGEACETCDAWRAAEVEADRRQRLAAEHATGGTQTGYQLHMRLQEPICEACREANRAACQRSRRRRAHTPAA
ncbi:WhiB family transcriptional regulator [Streptomyces sp. NPDC054975]